MLAINRKLGYGRQEGLGHYGLVKDLTEHWQRLWSDLLHCSLAGAQRPRLDLGGGRGCAQQPCAGLLIVAKDAPCGPRLSSADRKHLGQPKVHTLFDHDSCFLRGLGACVKRAKTDREFAKEFLGRVKFDQGGSK